MERKIVYPKLLGCKYGDEEMCAKLGCQAKKLFDNAYDLGSKDKVEDSQKRVTATAVAVGCKQLPLQ